MEPVRTVLLQGGAIVIGGILRPTVGMMHATPWWIAGADGGLECSNSEPCIDRAADGGTYDATGPSIEDRSQGQKAGRARGYAIGRSSDARLAVAARSEEHTSELQSHSAAGTRRL